MALTKVSTALFILFVYDFVFLLVLVAIVAVLSGTKRAAFAVMKRNFVGYFSNPTGYVFLCIFVFLTSLAAFWPVPRHKARTAARTTTAGSILSKAPGYGRSY